jgi:hypothetical protein
MEVEVEVEVEVVVEVEVEFLNPPLDSNGEFSM